MVTCPDSDSGSDEGVLESRATSAPKPHSWSGVDETGRRPGPRPDRLDNVEQRDRGQIPREHPTQPAPARYGLRGPPRALRSARGPTRTITICARPAPHVTV